MGRIVFAPKPLAPIQAGWHEKLRTLILVAVGYKPLNVSDVYFKPIPGSKFLYGLYWVVEDTGEFPPQYYNITYTQPLVFANPGTVTIRTANGDVPVTVRPIDNLDEMQPDSAAVSAMESTTAAEASVPDSDPEHSWIPRIVRVGESFEIVERVPLNGQSFARADIHYVKSSLKMEGASFRDGCMVWEFVPIARGFTNATTTVWSMPGSGQSKTEEFIIIDADVHTQASAQAVPQSVPAAIPAQAPTAPAANLQASVAPPQVFAAA